MVLQFWLPRKPSLDGNGKEQKTAKESKFEKTPKNPTTPKTPNRPPPCFLRSPLLRQRPVTRVRCDGVWCRGQKKTTRDKKQTTPEQNPSEEPCRRYMSVHLTPSPLPLAACCSRPFPIQGRHPIRKISTQMTPILLSVARLMQFFPPLRNQAFPKVLSQRKVSRQSSPPGSGRQCHW